MKFALYVLRHPIDGFWTMKFEKKGSVRDGCLLILLAILALIFNRQTRAFVFNAQYAVPLDILHQIEIVVLPVILFCISNWAITTLLNGKGTMRDIFLVVCYSLIPLILFNVIAPLLSHVLSATDSVYLILVDIIGYAWTALMILIGIQVIHEYTFPQMFGTLALTACSAAIIIFICLLFFSLLQELGSFIYTIYLEIALRS